MAKIKEVNPIGKDVGIILLSIFVAIFIVESGIMHRILESHDTFWVSSIIAGIFFTSVFTTAPAIFALAEISSANSLLWVSFFGAIGALIGDLIIFKFVRERLSDDIIEFFKEHPNRRLKAIVKSRLYRRLLPFLGAIVIASPLPDEIGLVMLGTSHLNAKSFIFLSFVFNFFGILAIGLVTRAIL